MTTNAEIWLTPYTSYRGGADQEWWCDPATEPIKKLVVPWRSIRVTTSTRNGQQVEIRVRDTAKRDGEYDPAHLAIFDIHGTIVDSGSWPFLEIHGFISKLCWTDEVQLEYPDRENSGWKYVPDPDPNFKPGLYKVNIYLTDPEDGED